MPGEVGVMKFGGSTFMETADYPALAKTLQSWQEERGQRLVAVVSALHGDTERLRALLASVWPAATVDAFGDLLPMADSLSAHLLCAALNGAGSRAVRLEGRETGFVAASPALPGRLAAISPAPLTRALTAADIVVLPGGQAADDTGRAAWLGKNSSDVSAVAAAVAVGARECDIFSDVDGVYSCDPNVVGDSALFPDISYASTALMGRYGAKVLHPEAVELAERHGIRIRCRRNRPPYEYGSVVGPDAADRAAVVFNERSRALLFETEAVASAVVTGLTGAGIRALYARVTEGPCALVIGEYHDTAAVLRRLGLPAGIPAGLPVVEIVGTAIRVHIRADKDDAIRYATAIHRSLQMTATADNLA